MASYYVWSGATGSANGTSWANAYTTLTLAFSGKVAGDLFYVAHDHAESSASTLTLSTAGTIANPSKVVCANRAGSVPPVSADRRATATVTTTGTTAISFGGFTHYDGIIFSAGTGAGGSSIVMVSTGGLSMRFDNCSLRLVTTSGAGTDIIRVGGVSSAYGQYLELNNTTLSFNNAGQSFAIGGSLRWRNTASALLGTIPTNLFSPLTSYGGDVECLGVDLSAAGSGKTLVAAATTSISQTYKFVDCKLNASVTKSGVPGSYGGLEVDFVRCSATGNYAVARQRIGGLLTEETTIVRTGGATDGTTPLAWKVVSTANCTYSLPFECPPIALWCDTTGSAKTATIECIGAAIATDKEVWLDLEYSSDAGSPQGAIISDSADLLATAANQTSSSASWGGSTAPFKLAVTFTPQQKGWVYARVRCAKASSTFYVDPLITLS